MIQHIFRLLIALTLSFSAFLATAQEATLNPAWQFLQDDSLDVKALEGATGWRLVNLPHTWNRYDAFDEEEGYKRGVGWYRKTLYLPRTENNRLFLKFEGANQHTTIYVNGKKAGEHAGGYTAFVVDITAQAMLDAGNTIVVKVDNRYDKAIPPLSADFTFYGGIYRDLWLLRKPEQFFDLTDGSTKGVYLSTPKISEEHAQLRVLAKVRNTSVENQALTIAARLFSPDGALIEERSKKINVGAGLSGQQEIIFEINKPKLWTPARPVLYRVEVGLIDPKGQTLDSFTARRGFRWVKMDESRALLLNGKPLKLIGTNHHQDYPGLGNALPDELHRRDIRILKDMGANFLRVSHYPQDPALLDACDELGILAWEEIPIVNSITVSDAFKINSVQMLREMIRQHYNHTSIIIWGFMNEVLLRVNNGLQDNPWIEEKAYVREVEKLAAALNAIAKEEDPSRWTAIAHHGNYKLYEDAGMNEITDIVGWNLYYGWYSANMPEAGEFLGRFHEDHPDKGIIIAEYGGGSDPRLHAIEPKRFDFSIEWQTAIHASYYQQMLAHPYIMGGAVWNFADFGSEGRKDAVPHINSKGI
ncbi:MAG: beta galactosidase jelly roll domain-containing protein, partial [Phaeodactylibacter sp.]|nr:beta galactosidase jelly roll domain-containing protein [Phaeodactylibacter sp.]